MSHERVQLRYDTVVIKSTSTFYIFALKKCSNLIASILALIYDFISLLLIPTFYTGIALPTFYTGIAHFSTYTVTFKVYRQSTEFALFNPRMNSPHAHGKCFHLTLNV